MFEERIIVAGFGGQGVLMIGKLLAHAGMMEGRQVTWRAILWTGNARRHRQLQRHHFRGHYRGSDRHRGDLCHCDEPPFTRSV